MTSDRMTTGDRLAALAERARRLYAACVANTPFAQAWWTAVVITASSQRQAERYHWEIRRREMAGRIPTNVRYIVVPDTGDQRIGSGATTLNAIRVLTRQLFAEAVTQPEIQLADW